MASLMLSRAPFNIIRILATCALVAGCTRGGGSASHGGQDGGGGDPFQSTSTQVVTAIKKARAFFFEGDPRLVYWRLSGDDLITFQKILFPEMVKKKSPAELKAEGIEDITDYLPKSRIVINDAHPDGYELAPPYYRGSPGPCPSHHGDATASVSKNDFGADICFNIDRLRVHSPQSIDKEVFALFFHELAHLEGLDETEAVKVQTVISGNYESIMNSSRSTYRTQLYFRLLNMIQFYAYTFQYLNLNQMNRFYLHLGGLQSAMSVVMIDISAGDKAAWAFDDFSQREPIRAAYEKILLAVIKMGTDLDEGKITREDALAQMEKFFADVQVKCAETVKMVGMHFSKARGCDGTPINLEEAANAYPLH